MTIKEIKSKLCYYDINNPDGHSAETIKSKKDGVCYCDNCFTGKTPLAKELLKLHEIIEDLKNENYEG